MNFLAPEKIFILNLWHDRRSSRDFSRALSEAFCQNKRLIKRTREKVVLKIARPFQAIQKSARCKTGVAVSNVAFCERATQRNKQHFWARDAEKVECYMNFWAPEKNSALWIILILFLS